MCLNILAWKLRKWADDVTNGSLEVCNNCITYRPYQLVRRHTSSYISDILPKIKIADVHSKSAYYSCFKESSMHLQVETITHKTNCN